MNEAACAVVEFRQQGRVGVIELNRPRQYNSLGSDSLRRLAQAVDAFEAEGSPVRAVLVCGLGKHFCTGADLDELRGLRDDPTCLQEFLRAGHEVFRRIERSELPFVVACQGLCLAGGLELMMACDIALASSDARFGDQHSQFGVIPGWGGSQRLTRQVGARRALDLFLSARWIDAQTAQHWGLVNTICEPDSLRADALAYCELLTRRSRPGLAAMKRLARSGQSMSLDQGLRLELDEATRLLQGDDVAEGLAAFAERREPDFNRPSKS